MGEQKRDRKLRKRKYSAYRQYKWAEFIGGCTERGWESGKEVLRLPKIPRRWDFKGIE
jgi:hypothetical protein